MDNSTTDIFTFEGVLSSVSDYGKDFEIPGDCKIEWKILDKCKEVDDLLVWYCNVTECNQKEYLDSAELLADLTGKKVLLVRQNELVTSMTVKEAIEQLKEFLDE